MRDQAEKLRMQMLQSQSTLGKSIAVVSGKGGVGKSNFATNFAAMLASEGKKVVVLDMDIGMGNVHVLIGKTVKYSLKDYLDQSMTLEEVTYEGPNQLQYISGGSGMSSILEWSPQVFDKLIEAFEQLQQSYDFILFDMGAGATNWSLDLLMSVDEIIVITTAEPTSIMDAYSMMKYIHLKDAHKNFYLLCNRAFTKEEGEDTTGRLKQVMQRFLAKDVVILGSLPEDPVVRQAVRQQIPFSILYPDAPITKTLQRIVQNFMGQQELQEAIYASVEHNTFLSKLKKLFSKGRD